MVPGPRRAEAQEVNSRFRNAAEADVGDAFGWYREQRPELGEAFLEALDQCVEAIERNPEAFAKVHAEIRRALLRRFPYCVYYIITAQEVVVLAFIVTATRRCGRVGATHDYGIHPTSGGNNVLTSTPATPAAGDAERYVDVNVDRHVRS